MSSRVYRRDHADNDSHMFRSIWQSVAWAVDDKLRFMRQVSDKPDQSNVASQPAESGQSHRCERHNERNCNCTGGACADDDVGGNEYRGPLLHTPKPNKLGNFQCPVSGQLCSEYVCREWCESSSVRSKAKPDRRSTKAAEHYRNLDSEAGAS